MRCTAAFVVLLTLSSVATASDTCASQGEACTDDTSLLSVSPQLHKRGQEAAKPKADQASKIFWMNVEHIENFIKDKEKKDGLVLSPILQMGTRLAKISAKSLTGISSIAESLKDQCLSYSKTIPAKITGTATEKVVAIEKEVEETVETFLEKWKQMAAMHRKLVADSSKVLIGQAGHMGGADEAMKQTMDPIFTLNDNFESELNKAKESVVGLHSMSAEEIGEHLDQLHQHVKRAGSIAKEGGLYWISSSPGVSVSFPVMTLVPEQIKPQVGAAFDNLRTLGDTIFQDLLSSIRDLASGIQKGIEIAQMERKQETTLTAHNVAVAGTMAILAAGLVYFFARTCEHAQKQEYGGSDGSQ